MHGWRARIGLLVPAVNNTMERELWSLVPDGVTVSTARIVCEREGTADTLRAMEFEGKAACERVITAEPQVVLFGCTSASFSRRYDELEGTPSEAPYGSSGNSPGVG